MKILPCPFCGDDDPLHDEISPDVFAVICGTCGTIGPSYYGWAGGVSDQLETLLPTTTIDYAVGAWNSRADADLQALRRWVRGLEEELAIWQSVFPDIAPEQVQPDRRKLLDEIERLRGALQQYAEPNNWGYYDSSGCDKGRGMYTEACFLGPNLAREALGDE